MAIGDMAFNNFQQMQFQAREMEAKVRQSTVGLPLETVNGNVPSGSLIIADVFSPTNPGDRFSHGEMVNMSAVRDGFRGNVLTQASNGPANRVTAEMDAEKGLFNGKATPEQTRANLGNLASNNALHLLEGQTQLLNGATASGAKNSVLNLSAGGSVAALTARVYGMSTTAWDKDSKPEIREMAQTLNGNLAGAYGLSVDKLNSTNPKVSGPERARLQEALANGFSTSLEGNPQVKKAKQDFTTAVGRFESGRNSVVIASGNEGDYADQLATTSHGQKATNLPKNFTTNFLDTPEATMVGATRWSRNGGELKERVADYSNRNSGVDIYASGSLNTKSDGDADAFGTSFATPRVAATMAALHKQNPNLSSTQVEALMKQSLTHQLNSGGGTVSVLDYQKSSDYMVGRDPSR